MAFLGGLVRISAAGRTDVGRKRAHNEDRIFVGKQTWVVADGMGGHAAGEIASEFVVSSLEAIDTFEDLRSSDVIDAVGAANQRILDHTRAWPESAGMGTTVAGLASVKVGGASHWAIFNVGDSRVYRCQGGALKRATVDHSETEELILAGKITEAEARHHESRNVITRSIGSQPPPQVDLWLLPQTPGERFVVCSDGVTSELPDERIAEIVLPALSPQAAVDDLVEAALVAGGHDNISAIVVDLWADADAEPEEATLPRVRIEEVS